MNVILLRIWLKIWPYVAVVGAVLAFFGTIIALAFARGRKHAEQAAAIKTAQDRVRDAVSAAHASRSAQAAANEVAQQQAAQAPPDPTKRNDFDNTGF